MEQRLANTWRMTINERKFIQTALLSDLRVDGRRLFDYRRLTIKFGREDGSSEVQLGQTHVMGFVTGQLVQPYRDRPKEGTLSIYTEFSPMADPSFEAGRPGESAVELGRIIDRGLRESRAVDTESLCVLAGKLVWSIRIDLHILDNAGNLVDAANIAALVALMTFRRPECTLGSEDDQEVIVHPPEEREPLPLIVHHLPIAVTFAFFTDENIVVIDPTHFEEAIMGGRMTATLNTHGEICAIQKPGGVGIMQSVVMQCLRIASVKAADITTKIKSAVESYNTERALRKIKRHPSSTTVDANITDSGKRESKDQSAYVKGEAEHDMRSFKTEESNDMEVETPSSRGDKRDGKTQKVIGGLSNWDPYSKGVVSDFLKVSLASRGQVTPNKEQDGLTRAKQPSDSNFIEASGSATLPSAAELSKSEGSTDGIKTLKDAVKPKNKRKKKASSAPSAS